LPYRWNRSRDGKSGEPLLLQQQAIRTIPCCGADVFQVAGATAEFERAMIRSRASRSSVLTLALRAQRSCVIASVAKQSPACVGAISRRRLLRFARNDSDSLGSIRQSHNTR
jgi:hypothetical protein